MGFFENFDSYVAPLHPLGVVFGVLVSGAIGGAIIARQESKNVSMWAGRGAAVFSLCTLVGAHISSAVDPTVGGGLLGLLVGSVAGCVALVVLVTAGEE